ncbi:MAG: PEP-CTERM sorting domain-containing protein [Tepidisphaeraceae bacterium]
MKVSEGLKIVREHRADRGGCLKQPVFDAGGFWARQFRPRISLFLQFLSDRRTTELPWAVRVGISLFIHGERGEIMSRMHGGLFGSMRGLGAASGLLMLRHWTGGSVKLSSRPAADNHATHDANFPGRPTDPNRWRMLLLQLATVALALLAMPAPSDAQVTLTSGNSTALVDPTAQAGMFYWAVQGQNQLQQQWFWYGIGGAPLHSIDTISAPLITTSGTNEATATYTSPGNFSVSIDYTLTGGTVRPAGQYANADLGEAIKIVNLSGTALPFHFYEYSYFNLEGASNDTVQLGTNVVGKYNDAYQFDSTSALSETVVTPGADHGEVAPLGATLAKLNGGGPVVLGPPFFAGPLGPGAVTWAFEWDLAIAPGGSPIISKDKSLNVLVVPEPSSLALLSAGVVALLPRRRRRGRAKGEIT